MDFVQNSKRTMDIDQVRAKNKAAAWSEDRDVNENYGIKTVTTPNGG